MLTLNVVCDIISIFLLSEFLKIKEVDEAKEIINEKFNEYYTPQSEIIDIAESNNRITFSKIESKIDFPPFNRSLKDGFAIKSEDSYGVNEENPKKYTIPKQYKASIIL